MVFGSVDPEDWKATSSEMVVAAVLRKVAPGSIVVLHDGRPRRDIGSSLTRQHTLEALETILPALRADGYRAVTMFELLSALGPAVPGAGGWRWPMQFWRR